METTQDTDSVVVLAQESPAPTAEAQKVDETPAPDADAENPEPVEDTPEQAEQKRESRRQRSNARKAAELASARTEARLLRERLDALEATTKQPQQTGEPDRAKYDSDEAYLRAVIRHDAADAARNVVQTHDQQREQQGKQSASDEAISKSWNEREKTFAATTKDYDAVATEFVESEMHAFSEPAKRAIVESEKGPELIYYLATHPDEADKFEGLSPYRQAALIGKLEDRITPPTRKPSTAPTPPTPIAASRTSSKDPNAMSHEEYRTWRKTQGARWA